MLVRLFAWSALLLSLPPLPFCPVFDLELPKREEELPASSLASPGEIAPPPPLPPILLFFSFLFLRSRTLYFTARNFLFQRIEAED